MQDYLPEKNGDANIFQIITELRQDALFISNEKMQIEGLNKQIKEKVYGILQSAWVTTKKRLLLMNGKELNFQNYQNNFSVGSVEFVEAKNTLGFWNSDKLTSLFYTLQTQPEQFAQWLTIGEQIEGTNSRVAVLPCLVTGLYGSFLFTNDVKYVLRLLFHLAKYQLERYDKPQRALKQSSSLFNSLYFMFHENLLPAKYFLSEALEVSILQLLTIDYYLDVEESKSHMRYSQEETVKAAFKDQEEYRDTVLKKLSDLTDAFILSIYESRACFPESLSWLIFRIAKLITEKFDANEADASVTELVFTMFICPAIVNPEQYGICDSQVTDVARHNLMQVGQIIQNIALTKHETENSKVDVYKIVQRKVIISFLEELPRTNFSNSSLMYISSLASRDKMLFTLEELNSLVSFLHKVRNELLQNGNCEKHSGCSDVIDKLQNLNLASVENSPINRPNHVNANENTLKRSSNFFSIGTRNPKLEEAHTSSVVLVFPIQTDDTLEPIGLLPEEKFAKLESKSIISKENNEINEIGSQICKVEVKTNFSAYPDEGSIGNTSDNLEAISEAASNHSVGSSLEMENEDQNDNFSDMISANVSGRGTPNISGRDTPSSQVNENEDRPIQEQRSANDIVTPQRQLSRQIRSEIDDKFCKFEIKLPAPGGDETVSLISDTWSTDVLASDNETVDANDSRNDRSCYSRIDQAISETPIGQILDISETQSESAWSTDVMTSDTERLTEIDNDDIGSIAQSDDTNSVAPSDDTRSETDENITPGSRRQSNVSNSFVNHTPQTFTNYSDYKKMETRSESAITVSKLENERNIRREVKANSVFKSLTFTNSQETNQVFVEQNFEVKIPKIANGTIDMKEFAGPSGFQKIGNLSYLNHNVTKFGDISHEILLSNCSLNSNSSGSSNNSFENKNSHKEVSEKWENKQWLNSSQTSLNVTSTPSESTSELSVLSVSNINQNGNNVNIKSNTLRSAKIQVSTGAIPKSISFDVSADKGDKYFDDDHRNKRGFFGKIRQGFRARRLKSIRNADDLRIDADEFGMNNHSGNEKLDETAKMNNIDVSDDILAKYRSKPFSEVIPQNLDETLIKSNKNRLSNESTGSNDGINTFYDIQNKLKMIFQNITIQVPAYLTAADGLIKNKIEIILRMEIGKARKRKDWPKIAKIFEAIRCIKLLNENNCLKLMESLKDDANCRLGYVQYLAQSRKSLLLNESYLETLNCQVVQEQQRCEEYLAMICVKEYLAAKEENLEQFSNEFKHLSLSDEKCDLLNNFFSFLYSEMKKDATWKEFLRDRESTIKAMLKKKIISRVYEYALYPNGDGDRDRDSVLREHIQRLSSIITPDNKYLMIPKEFLRECPWQPAQDALKIMSAYRTPRGKLNCVMRCAASINDLLFMAHNGCSTADDMTPVLVFVIIKANPSDLLSTIQFVNTFYHNQLTGEKQYFWTQFCAAVEFIKTMDYSD